MKEKINAKLAELEKQREQAVAQLNAILGAIQTLQELLKEGANYRKLLLVLLSIK